MDTAFILNSIALGFGLAMDAFCVSMANGLNEPGMSGKKRAGIAGMYGIFQFLMPMIGWFCVHTIASYFKAFQKFIPWIALILLLYIGGGMLREGIRSRRTKKSADGGSVRNDAEGCGEQNGADDRSGQKDADAGNGQNGTDGSDAASEHVPHVLTMSELVLQAVATSIDALSVGFTLAGYDALSAVCACLLILAVTFVLSYIGVLIGRKFGTMLAGRANILGGIILIAIGLEIFIRGVAGI